MIRLPAAALLVVALGPTSALAQAAGFTAEEQSLATADVINSEGQPVGTVAFVETPSGLLVQPNLQGLPEGEHAIHIHEVGICEPPGFESAGGHYNPTGAEHGFLSPNGPHTGDLPNIHVGPDGVLRDDILTTHVSLVNGQNPLFPRQQQGASIVIHESLDDYRTDPAGASGARIACGVIELQAAEAAEIGAPPAADQTGTEDQTGGGTSQ